MRAISEKFPPSPQNALKCILSCVFPTPSCPARKTALSFWTALARICASPPRTARFLASRRGGGVGCDQVLLLEPAQSGDEADFRYRIFNADGSEVGQCGNGARCAWRFLRESGLSDKDEIVLRAEEFRVEKITVRAGETPDTRAGDFWLPAV